jgi:hypothetical protein
LVAIAIGIAMLGGTAHAQKFDYDCDTLAEHFSQLKVAQTGPTYSASATVALQTSYAIKKYVTLGGFSFEAADGSWAARLRLVAMSADKTTVMMGTLAVTRNGKAEPEQTVGDVLEYQPGKPYPIKLTLGPDGGSATLGSTTIPVNLKATGTVNVSVICSGGEFLFTNLDMSGR